MKIKSARALVTGANRGLGKSLVTSLLAAGCETVYAGVRDPSKMSGDKRTQVVELDICIDESVEAAARACPDTNLLINNAAIVANTGLIRPDNTASAREEMETNYWGTLRMCRTFAPLIAAGGGGMIVNILSIGALASIPFAGSYCATKAATLSLTQCIRAELSSKAVHVMAVVAGGMATDMARPEEQEGRHPTSLVATNILAAIRDDQDYAFPDPTSSDIAELFASDPWSLEKQFSQLIDDLD